jgi:hypothetical protein
LLAHLLFSIPAVELMMPPAEETVEEARYCRKCNTIATFLEEAIDECYERGECLLISCAGAECREHWMYCKSCKKRFNSNNVTAHAKTNKHKINHEKLYPSQNFKNIR